MDWLNFKHVLSSLFFMLFSFILPAFSQSLGAKLDSFITSDEGWVWNIKQKHQELAEPDEIIIYIEKAIRQYCIFFSEQTKGDTKKQFKAEREEQRILMALYLMELSPNAKYTDVLKIIIEDTYLSDYTRSKAVLSLGSTKTSSTYIFNLLHNNSDHLSATALHALALGFAFEPDIKLLKNLLNEMYKDETDYTGTLTGEQLAEIKNLIYFKEGLNKEKDLASKANFILKVPIDAAIFPGTPYYRTQSLTTKYVLEQMQLLFRDSPNVVTDLVHLYWQISIEERLKTIYILLELKIPLKKEEQSFYKDMLKLIFSPCVEGDYLED
ncbi:MAG: hypothetical protein FD167_2734 [bacterium]|nr:MAG: hypothetical protein FD167_2734 [bacterium]